MALPNSYNFINFGELINCNTYLSPPLSMAHKLYSENQIIQGIKDQDKTVFSWILKSMARETIDLFDDIGLGDLATEKDYQTIFQDGMERVYKNIRSDKVNSGVLKCIKNELREQTIEHFLFEEKMKSWLFKNYRSEILDLIKKVRISTTDPDAAHDIFNKIYEYLCQIAKKDDYKAGNVTSNITYNIKLKTVEHYIDDEKTWTWIDNVNREPTINSFLGMIKNRQDIDCNEIFTEVLNDVWKSVNNGKYVLGNNLFWYLRRAYKFKLISTLNKPKKETIFVTDEPIESNQKALSSWEAPVSDFDLDIENRLSNEILSEVMIKTIDEMKDNSKNLIYDFRIKGKSLRQIAESKGVKESSMKVLNNRATTSLLNQYFERLLAIVTEDMDNDCIGKLQNKSLKSTDQTVFSCRKKLKTMAQSRIKDLINKVLENDPSLSEDSIKSFIHFLMGSQLRDEKPVSIKDLSKWKANYN